MKQEDQFRFVSLLALELDNGDISLPSLPDVVMKIRKLLSSEDCDFGRVSQAVSVDPVLVSRLFVFANSAFYNRANVKIETLDGAIGRLGFEVVRSAAMSLAMKQLPRKLWRWVHHTSLVLYFVATYHAIAAGTDAENQWFRVAALASRADQGQDGLDQRPNDPSRTSRRQLQYQLGETR